MRGHLKYPPEWFPVLPRDRAKNHPLIRGQGDPDAAAGRGTERAGPDLFYSCSQAGRAITFGCSQRSFSSQRSS
jgi:hypothetical protein